jgi:DNA adenine methylase
MTKIYVEPFVGSGAIFFDKEKSPINILNDLDKKRTDMFKLIKKAPIDPELYNKGLTTPSKQEAFIKKDYTDIPSILIKNKILLTGGFMKMPFKNKVYVANDPYEVFKHMGLYKDKLKGTKILNQDYEKVIKQYDGPDTFFYLDPPYNTKEKMNNEETGYVGGDEFDFERLYSVLQKIKGKFLMSMDNSQYIKDLFKKFKIKEVRIPINREPKFRKELLISNYDLHI